ncbi:helix-turn-helix domain-containing protein [Rugamonas sp. FT107W]|uniref:Helix-turn-helix domain-containing protein n=1 Tax=Duganella vulcania TaxID=2692166 RepID=A0A845HRR5_9BURK|nr:helix-turn-helix domain-containing protein [Duganella vulcania]
MCCCATTSKWKSPAAAPPSSKAWRACEFEADQPQLATITGISKATLRAIEADRLELTLEQATVLAKALQVTPAILMATGSDASNKSAA